MCAAELDNCLSGHCFVLLVTEVACCLGFASLAPSGSVAYCMRSVAHCTYKRPKLVSLPLITSKL